MPPLNEGVDPLHADHAARDLGRRGGAARSRCRTACCARSRRWSACTARRAGPRRPTDPAPLSMIETVVVLKPPSEWRAEAALVLLLGPGMAEGACCGPSGPTASRGRRCSREMDRALRIPGTANSWTMPIKGRIDMQTHRAAQRRRDQDPRQRPARVGLHEDRARGRDAGDDPARRAGHAQRLRRARRRAATSWTSSRSATGSRATASRSPRCRP